MSSEAATKSASRQTPGIWSLEGTEVIAVPLGATRLTFCNLQTALLETAHHHARFMASTKETPGWTSQFREIVLDIRGRLHDLRGDDSSYAGFLNPSDYAEAKALGEQLRTAASDGLVYPSVRSSGGTCVGLFYPDLAVSPVQRRHLDYRWDGVRIDLFREPASGKVYRIM